MTSFLTKDNAMAAGAAALAVMVALNITAGKSKLIQGAAAFGAALAATVLIKKV